MNFDKKVLLYSGGLDSYIISYLWKPDIKLYFDLGTEQSAMEKAVLPSDVIVRKLELGCYIQNDGFNTIPLRNLLFVTLALNFGNTIALGGLLSDIHQDTKPEFATACTQLINEVFMKEGSHRNIQVVVPAGNYTKTQLVFRYLQKGGDIEQLEKESWSCYTPINGKPCGKCQACKARNKAIFEAQKLYYNR